MELEKEEQVKPKVDIGEKKIQQGQWKKKKQQQQRKSVKLKAGSLKVSIELINRRLIRKKREDTNYQYQECEGDITIDPKDIKIIIMIIKWNTMNNFITLNSIN